MLFDKEYFSYKESAYNYVFNIVNYIEQNIHILPHNSTPNLIQHLGNNFIIFQVNKNTTWYVLFDKPNEDIYITFIFNNHEKFAKYIAL